MNISQIYKKAKNLHESGLQETQEYYDLCQKLKKYSESVKTNLNEIDIELTKDDCQDLLTESQILQIRSQILGFKYNIRNLQIPRDIEKNMFTISKENWDNEKERIFQRSNKFFQENVEKNFDLLEYIKKTSKPFDNSETKESLNKVQIKIKEKNKNKFDKYFKSEIIDENFKKKLQTELKFAKLTQFYDITKEKLEKSVVDTEILQLETKLLTREKFKMEKNRVPTFVPQSKKLKWNEFLNSLWIHQTEFFEFHRMKYRQNKKKSQNAKTYSEWLEKREQEQKERAEKERVKALRANDFDAYIKMVQKIKNNRIIELLEQTENFLKEIGAKVVFQKGESMEDDEKNENTEKIDEQTKIVRYYQESTRVYYKLAHSKEERIKEQPSLLQNGVLKSYQIIGLEWLISLYNNKLNGILADEMGLGKTIQTIALFCYLMEFKKVFGPFLVIVPLTTLSNWLMEFDRWAPSIKKCVYKGPVADRKEIAQVLRTTKWNVCLTTYEYVLRDKIVLNKFDWKYIIVDEGHRMKNSKSKFALTLAQYYSSTNRLILTGTPLQNNIAELWSLLNFLLPRVFSSSDEFEKWFSMPLGKLSSENEAQLNEEEQLLIINRLHQVLRPFLLRRVKKEVESELPSKLEFVIKVELSAWQRIVYNQITNRGLLVYDPSTGEIRNKALMNLMMQLRKICNHPYLFLKNDYIPEDDDEIWRCSGKFELLDRILPKLIGTGHRMLIFSQMTQLMDILEDFFEYRQFRHLRLDGNTKAEERFERMALFNEENSQYDIFLLSTRAGGLGLNLQSADTVILFDSDWNPQMDLQAQDRAHRIGQKNEVRVLRLVTNTLIEEEILCKAGEKMNLDEIIIQAGLFNQKSTDTERRERLSKLLKCKNLYEDLDECEIPTDDQINEMLYRNEEELLVFEEFDNDRNIKNKKTRLILEEETPYWIRNHPKEKRELKNYGRGNRERKSFKEYYELSDEEDFEIDENEGKFKTFAEIQITENSKNSEAKSNSTDRKSNFSEKKDNKKIEKRGRKKKEVKKTNKKLKKLKKLKKEKNDEESDEENEEDFGIEKNKEKEKEKETDINMEIEI